MQEVVSAPRPVSSGEAIIRVQNVSKRFGRGDKAPLIVRDLNFEVKPGQIFCLLGPSGSGKSTTMRMLTGVYRPSEGSIRVLGVEPHRFRKRTRARMGYMPQQFVLFPELSTIENINFVASVYGMNWFGRAKKVRQALEFVDLWDARNRLAANLSGGMQRRLELASTLVHGPKLIFVDEPTAGIDPILRAKFWEHFHGLRDEGRTLFVTTQYVTEADYCDMVAILNRGRLLALGTPEQIRQAAMGGEIINLTLEEVTSQAVRILRKIPEMRRVKTLSTENIQLTVADSGEALPEIMDAFRQNDINIQSIEPYHPNFEEVFVQLMEQDTEEDDEQENEGNSRPDNRRDKASTSPQKIVAPPRREMAANTIAREYPPAPRSEQAPRPVRPPQPEIPGQAVRPAPAAPVQAPLPPQAVPERPLVRKPEVAPTSTNDQPTLSNVRLSEQDFGRSIERPVETAAERPVERPIETAAPSLQQPITQPLSVNGTPQVTRQAEEQI